MECPICHGKGTRGGHLCDACNGTGNIFQNPMVAGGMLLFLLFIMMILTLFFPPVVPFLAF